MWEKYNFHVGEINLTLPMMEHFKTGNDSCQLLQASCGLLLKKFFLHQLTVGFCLIASMSMEFYRL